MLQLDSTFSERSYGASSFLDFAEKLAQSKSDLVSTLSHEIRNGLTGVAHVLAAAAGQNGRAAPSREQAPARGFGCMPAATRS